MKQSNHHYTMTRCFITIERTSNSFSFTMSFLLNIFSSNFLSHFHFMSINLAYSFHRTEFTLVQHFFANFQLFSFSITMTERTWQQFFCQFFCCRMLNKKFRKPLSLSPSTTSTHANFGKSQKNIFSQNELGIFYCC